MTHTEIIMMALLAACGLFFILPALAARRGGFNFPRVLCVVFAFGLLTACGKPPPPPPPIPFTGDVCEYAKQAFIRAYEKYQRKGYWDKQYGNAGKGLQHARLAMEAACKDEEGEGSPYQQVCPAGAACNQGVK